MRYTHRYIMSKSRVLPAKHTEILNVVHYNVTKTTKVKFHIQSLSSGFPFLSFVLNSVAGLNIPPVSSEHT